MSAPTAPSALPVTIAGQLWRHTPRYLVGAVFLAVYQASQYWFDTRLAIAIDRVTGGAHQEVLTLGAALAAVALAAFVIRVFSRLAIFNAGRQAEYELRVALLDRLQQLGPSFYRHMSTGEIMSRVTNDLAQLRLLLGFGVLNLVNTVFALASALAVTLSISPALTLASLATLPVLLLVTRQFSRTMFTLTRENQDALGQMSERVQASVAGVRVVRSFALEESEAQRFEVSNQRSLAAGLALARWRVSMGLVMQGLGAVAVIIVFWYGGHLMAAGDITAGGLLAFYRALTRLTWPLVALGFLLGLVQRGRAAYTRLADIYQATPEVVSGPLPAPERVQGALSVRDLSFAYGARPVLDHVSLELPPGGSLAIVGRTGSGKSTLAALLPRLQPTPRGAVFLDGHDVCDLPLSTVRATIGYAQQAPFLFSTTVARNAGYALDDPDAIEAIRPVATALHEAAILEEAVGLPEGLDTVVGERGVQLSGGQKQRVALARAFVSGPRILVLDDPLSAVDARTEASILQAIDRERARRAVVLITHRVAAASRCDRIVVLDEGRVVDEGTHAELCARPGPYATFAEEQRIEAELNRLGELELPSAPPVEARP